MTRGKGSGDASRNSPTFVCKTVGGTTVHWTALALRMKAHEFRGSKHLR